MCPRLAASSGTDVVAVRGGSEFDGERHSSQVTADACDVGCVLVVQRNVMIRTTLEEQPGGIECAEVGETAGEVGARNSQGGDSVNHLTGDLQWLASRREDSCVGTSRQQPFDERRSGDGRTLVTVDDEQRLGNGPEVVGDHVDRVGVTPHKGACPHHSGCDNLDVIVGDIGQSDPPHAARHGVRRSVCGRVRQSALADPRVARERDQPVGRQRPADDRQIRPAADEGTDRRGQVSGGGGSRLQRGEGCRQVRLRDLPDPFASIEPAEPVQAEVDDTDGLRHLVTELGDGVVRQQDLSAVTAATDTSAPDDRETDVVVLVAQHRLARVQRHACREVGQFSAQGELCVHGGCESTARVGEDSHDTVALALLLRTSATVGGDARLENVVVVRDQRRHLTGRGLPCLRRTFDVGEQERHHPRRQRVDGGTHRPILSRSHDP